MKIVISIISSMIIATILGVSGQGLAYFMTEHAIDINPVYYLTVFTVMSMLLYIVSFVLAYLVMKKEKVSGGSAVFSLLVISIVAVPVSMFSFFATAMWWG